MYLKENLFKGMWFKSIGWKITVWYAMFFLISSMLVSFYLYRRLEFQLYQEVDFFLSDEMNEFQQFVIEHQDKMPLIERQIQKESVAIRKNYQMYYGVLDREGKVILQSSELKPFITNSCRVNSSLFAASEIEEYAMLDVKSRYFVRVITQPFQNESVLVGFLQTGMNLTRIKNTLLHYQRNILLTLPLFFIISFVGGFFLARRNLKPLAIMNRTVSSITASNLKERLPIKGVRDEIDRLAQTFNQMIERLEQSYQKISQFSTDVAHELRTPITTLIGEVESALLKKHSSEDYRLVLLSNLEELSRLKCLVNNLLFLAQTENLEHVGCMQSLELNTIVFDIAELFKPVAEENGISFKVDIWPQPLYIKGDKSRIEQAVSNLLDNAVQYNCKGGSIIVSLQKKNQYAELNIQDTGIGMAELEQNKIFNRFYRISSACSRNPRGIGLGLSIVKSVVLFHSGNLCVNSQLGKGSIFTVQFPLQI